MVCVQQTLDESQRRVVDALPGERRIVVAGPGSGKTTTSIHLIGEAARRHLGDDDDRTVLYLAFSRAAMAAAFSTFGDSLREDEVDVAAMTLDSLAWQLVGESSDAGDVEPDFDDIVCRATTKLRTEYEDELDDISQLIVDEAQDLSAPRRELLCAVIDRLPPKAGVTIFGDPMQSIYEFLDDRTAGAGEVGWNQLLTDLASRSITKTYELENDHRARRRGPKKVSMASAMLRAADARSREDILGDLLTEFNRWDVGEFAQRTATWTGGTALLARTNADVVFLFDQLVPASITCTWRQPGRRHPRVARWVADLWAQVDGKPFGLNDFERFCTARSDVDPQWIGLLLEDAGRNDRVDWSFLAKSCQAAVDPLAPWYKSPGGDHVLSTIHQSKGLEWDNVGIAGADDLLTRVGRRQPECELLYVALSRARDRVVLVDWASPYTKWSKPEGLIYRPHPRSGTPISVAITPDCVVSDRAVGGADGQATLATCGQNAAVEFELLASGHSDWPTYRCRVGGVSVGLTTPRFGQTLARLIRGRGSGWPRLSDVALDGVETRWTTVAGTEFWLKPRPLGMAVVEREKE
jgi:DNA helicase-2/ATP-dependent DNA helicase PcrA